MANLNDIVNVNIDIATPAVDAASFDHLLIVGPPPTAGVSAEKPLPIVGRYSDLSEVTEAGYVAIGDEADPVGVAARIAFSQNPKPAYICIAAQRMTENDEGTERLATPVETLEAALATDGWYVICAAGIAERDLAAVAEWAEAQTKLFCYTFLAKTDPVSDIYLRSFGVCGLIHDNDTAEDVPEANKYIHVGMATRFLSYPAGSEMWENKTLAALTPSEISTTLRKELEAGHSSYFAQYAGRNIIRGGKVRGDEWIDVIRGRDWLQNDMRLRIFSLLLMQPKIPYTNPGIALVENEMIASLKDATTRGIVAPDEYDTDKNLIKGFTTNVPNSRSLTATQRNSRVLTGCKFTARLAGAIRAVTVNGTLTY